MSGFNSKQFQVNGCTHDATPRTGACCAQRRTKKSYPPCYPSLWKLQRQSRIARNKGTILTSCLGQREPLFLQSEGVTEVKTKGSPAARKGEVSTKLIQHHHACKFDTFTKRIQRHVRIYSYKQVRVRIYIYIHIYIHTSQTSFSPEARNNESNRRKP